MTQSVRVESKLTTGKWPRGRHEIVCVKENDTKNTIVMIRRHLIDLIECIYSVYRD